MYASTCVCIVGDCMYREREHEKTNGAEHKPWRRWITSIQEFIPATFLTSLKTKYKTTSPKKLLRNLPHPQGPKEGEEGRNEGKKGGSRAGGRGLSVSEVHTWQPTGLAAHWNLHPADKKGRWRRGNCPHNTNEEKTVSFQTRGHVSLI